MLKLVCGELPKIVKFDRLKVSKFVPKEFFIKAWFVMNHDGKAVPNGILKQSHRVIEILT